MGRLNRLFEAMMTQNFEVYWVQMSNVMDEPAGMMAIQVAASPTVIEQHQA
jgi:hypothetical protein